jgi:hypothetical protein
MTNEITVRAHSQIAQATIEAVVAGLEDGLNR